MKSREVYDKLKDKVDPLLLHTLMAMAEEHGVMKKQLLDMADMLDKTMDLVTKNLHVQDTLKNEIDKIRKQDPQDDLDDPVSTPLAN